MEILTIAIFYNFWHPIKIHFLASSSQNSFFGRKKNCLKKIWKFYLKNEKKSWFNGMSTHFSIWFQFRIFCWVCLYLHKIARLLYFSWCFHSISIIKAHSIFIAHFAKYHWFLWLSREFSLPKNKTFNFHKRRSWLRQTLLSLHDRCLNMWFMQIQIIPFQRTKHV